MKIKSVAQLFDKAKNLLARQKLFFQLKLINRMRSSDFASIDRTIKNASPQDIPGLLENIPLDLFGLLLLDVPSRYPNIRNFFPAMPPDENQDLWTGNHGVALLAQSLAFIKTLVSGYTELTTKDIKYAQVLDFGCGWGRLIRLLYKYVPYEQIYALDSWGISIEICKQYGIKANLAICDTFPSQIPFERQLDLIFAFSVFTHLSEKTVKAVLTTLRKYIADDGLLVITVRPKEYWTAHLNGKYQSEMTRTHDEKGFAFIPHETPPIDGDIPYGDTSISLDYLSTHFPQWKLVKMTSNFIDRYQTILFLRPV